MKLQIDTVGKAIKLEQSAKLTELFSLVKKIFPNNEWKEYSIEAVTIINNWSNPIIWNPSYYNQYNPFYVTCAEGQDISFSAGSTLTASDGIFCIESN